MLSREALTTIAACAREFDVGVVWLLGSSLEDTSHARDIDLAVEGLGPAHFFPF